MALVSWLDLLREHRISYIERGANVKRGEINIQCPFCGAADPSKHMGLNLISGYWACWRNANHRGKSPLRLLMRLLGISYERAREIAGLDANYIDPEGFDAIAARIMQRDFEVVREDQTRREFLQFDREFHDAIYPSNRWGRYLIEKRKFHRDDVDDLVTYYELRAADSGKFKDRLILPYFMGDDLVAWTGRAIGPSEIRYKDLATDECIIQIKKTFWNYNSLWDRSAKVLVVQEGQIDALKLDLYGRGRGVRSAALSTNTMSEDQLYMLTEVAAEFEHVVFMLDQNDSGLGIVDSMRMRSQVTTIHNARIMAVPFGMKDAGEFNPRQAVACVDKILREYTK